MSGFSRDNLGKRRCLLLCRSWFSPFRDCCCALAAADPAVTFICSVFLVPAGARCTHKKMHATGGAGTTKGRSMSEKQISTETPRGTIYDHSRQRLLCGTPSKKTEANIPFPEIRSLHSFSRRESQGPRRILLGGRGGVKSSSFKSVSLASRCACPMERCARRVATVESHMDAPPCQQQQQAAAASSPTGGGSEHRCCA